MDPIPTIAEISGIFLLAGLVKGLIGLGLPTIGLLGLLTAPAQAAALVTVPSLVTNIWQAVVGPALLVLLRRLWPMFAGICIGAWAGADIITGSDSALASGGLGVALIVYAVLGLSNIHVSVPPRAEIWMAPLVGVATGIVTGATGILTLPAVVYFLAIGLRKDELVEVLGLSFTVSTVALGATLMDSGIFRPTDLGLPLIALLAALIGTGPGQVLRTRTCPESFQRFFFMGLLLLGGHLALRVFL